jgi:3-deoxy-manno-octulosonate cytidylyltransferase (CMP-KDO synthetase)
MHITAIIPCRYASKRLEGKPLVPIFGKPMIQWVYERAGQAALLSDVVVATDDERIRACVRGFGGRVLMTSPSHRSGSDRAAEAAAALGLDDQDIVINIQGDQPALDPRCLPEVVSPLADDRDLVMATPIHRMTDPAQAGDPNQVKCVFDQSYFALYFSRAPIPFDRDGSTGSSDIFKHLGIYAYRKHFLDRFHSLPQGRLEVIEKLEQLRVLEHGYRIKVVVTEFHSKAVDTAEDVGALDALLRREGRLV